MRANRDNYTLKEGVSVTKTETRHQYVIPLTEDNAHSAFDALSQALWSLKPFGDNTEDDDFSSACVYAHRRFGRIFKTAYDYDVQEVDDWRIPTVSEIHSDIRWYQEDGLPARTITIRKSEDKLILTYEHGFKATDEVMEIALDKEEELKGESLYNCGQGIGAEHAPYNPSVTSRWRYGPSEVKFSIEQVGDTLRVGLENSSPNEPLWYRVYKHISTFSRPYARATFDMDNQTSVVKFVYNQKQDNEKDKL